MVCTTDTPEMAGRDRRDDTGASLVEFALILPLFFTLMLGMFTGGLAYSRRLSITDASREAARYGATLPLAAEATTDAWLARVAGVAESTADGELDATESSRLVCVAYIPASGTARRLERAGASPSGTPSNGTCFTDGRSNEARVQVVTERNSTLELLVTSRDLRLSSRSVARFEAP